MVEFIKVDSETFDINTNKTFRGEIQLHKKLGWVFFDYESKDIYIDTCIEKTLIYAIRFYEVL